MDKRGCLAATSQREGEVKGQALVVLEVSEIGPSHSIEQQVAMVMEGGVAMETEGVWQWDNRLRYSSHRHNHKWRH